MIQTLIGDWDVIDDNQRDKRAAGDGGSGEEPCYGVNQYRKSLRGVKAG